MKEFIEYLIKHLVDKPEEIMINEIVGKQIIVLELDVGAGDMGKIIGKQGRTVQSLRILLAAAAAKQCKHIILEIIGDQKLNPSHQ